MPEVWWSQQSWQREDPSQSSLQLWVLCPNLWWHWRMTSRKELWLHSSPYKAKSRCAIITYFCGLFLILSLSLLKVSLQETPYAIVEFANTKKVFVPSNTQSLIGESMMGVISSCWAEANKWWENIPQIFVMLLQNYNLHFEDEDSEAETYLCYTTWTWIYVVTRLDIFLTPCWVTYWELRR